MHTKNIIENITAGSPVPATMAAFTVQKTSNERLLERVTVPTPDIGPDEALVAVMAAGLNFNTLWTLRREPVSSFEFLKRLQLVANTRANHNLDYHIPGSDASGVVVQLGTQDTKWQIGAEVVLNCNWHRCDDPQIFDDSLLSTEQKIWGYETNYGSFAAFCVVKIHQLMPKPPHLNWSEAASYGLCLSTAYRMLMTRHGVQIKVGDSVLIWGAAGGLGLAAIQLCHLAGALPIPVVSSVEKGEMLKAKLGIAEYIDRSPYSFLDGDAHNVIAWRKFRNEVVKKFGTLPDVVFEHPGRETMGASVYVLKRGGRVVSCAATTGADILYDNRYLWMESKSIIGCHFANPKDAWEANQLVVNGKIRPYVSKSFEFDEANEAMLHFERMNGFGKIVLGVLSGTEAPTAYNLLEY